MIVRSLTLLAIVLGFALPLCAQTPDDVIAFGPMNIEFMSAPIAFDTEPVLGAPYSAEAVTEVAQTLADGNRIVRQNTAKISRDSKGRTRREQGFAVFGPLVNGPKGPGHVQISDPEAKTTILLDLENRLAHVMPAPQFRLANKAGATAVDIEKFEMAVPAAGVASDRIHLYSARKVAGGEPAGEPLVEPLGVQFMEGIAVEGTRTTVTIAAGQIGNELPINIVSERWFSPELKVLVMSRQSDPRFGETTYRLTNIERTEPPSGLFEVPSDFKVMEPDKSHGLVIQRKIQSKP
jgi:hypothetical protein